MRRCRLGRRGVPALLCIALLPFIAACGDQKDARVDAAASLDAECGSVPDGAARVTLTAPDGARLGAAVIGEQAARVGVVIAYGATQTLCDWLDQAERIADADGARVLVVDRRGVGSSSDVPANPRRWTEDIVAGVRWLGRRGAQRVALIGASFGGPIAVTAASPTGPRTAVFPPRPNASVIAPPCAAILISPATEAEADGGSISALAIREFRSPLFIVYEEGTRQFRDAAAALRDRLRSVGAPRVRLLSIPGTDHSIGLVEKHASARAFVDQGVRSCQKS